jgi:molybdopterin synthase catalytic subunit
MNRTYDIRRFEVRNRRPAGTVWYAEKAPVRVKVLFFGVLRDIAGAGEDCLELPPDATLSTVFDHYARRHPRLGEMRSSVMLARNQQFARGSTPIEDGDEIALLPPVSGGSGGYLHEIADPEGHFFALTRSPIDVAALKKALLGGEDGAAVTFEGVTRNNTRGRRTLWLDYECYEPMAMRTLADLGREIAGAHAVSRIAMVHRLGRLDVGETSVAILVTAPHRKPAFQACMEAIDRLKRVVPIWKKEHFEDGEVWVEGDWDSSLTRA